jgi:hypothetical protein
LPIASSNILLSKPAVGEERPPPSTFTLGNEG